MGLFGNRDDAAKNLNKMKQSLLNTAKNMSVEAQKAAEDIKAMSVATGKEIGKAIQEYTEQPAKVSNQSIQNVQQNTNNNLVSEAVTMSGDDMNKMGLKYLQAQGCKRDLKLAFEWFMKAAKVNNKFGCFNVGQFYEQGLYVDRDTEKAMEFYKKASGCGHFSVKNQIYMVKWMQANKTGVIEGVNLPVINKMDLFNDLRSHGRMQLAAYFGTLGASEGNVELLRFMGDYYLQGLGVSTNNKLAKMYYEEAAEKGNALAYSGLGKIYEYGLGVKKDLKLALTYYTKSIELGNKAAQKKKDNVESILQGEQDFSFDSQMSVEEFSQKAQYYLESEKYELRAKLFFECKDVFSSQSAWWHIVGLMYLNGEGVQQDMQKAIEYFEHVIAMNADYAKFSHKELGDIYAYGRGVAPDYKRALAEYEMAASMGINCLNEIDNLKYIINGYMDNELNGIKEMEKTKLNPDKIDIAKEIKEQTEDSATQLLNDLFYCAVPIVTGDGLGGYMYCQPFAVKANEYGFSVWNQMLEKLDNGEKLELSREEIKNNIAVCYLLGLGVEKDEDEALDILLELGEDENCLIAQLNLALISEKGELVETDYEAAFDYYSEAVAIAKDYIINHQKDLTSRVLTSMEKDYATLRGKGTLYARGMGVRRDYKKALDYYRLAAETGEVEDDEILDAMVADTEAAAYFMDNDYERYSGAPTDIIREYFYSSSDEEYILRTYELAKILTDRNDAEGIFYLGTCALAGTTEAQDVEKAIKLFEKARDLGFKDAVNILKKMSENGLYLGEESPRWQMITEDGEIESVDAEEVDEEYSTDVESVVEENKEDATKVSALPDNLDKYFEGMIGVDSVKKQLNKIYDGVKIKLKRNEIIVAKGGEPIKDDQGYNFILTGNPGTGKTQIARIIAQILYDIGIRDNSNTVEVDRSKLVGSHIGETEKRTSAVIDKAMGGTLFVDEAYTLYKDDAGNDFGADAIDTLLKAIEDKRDKFSVIIAGYREPMLEMIKNSNGGFGSRFAYTIDLPDFTDDELVAIAHELISKKHYVIEGNVDAAIKKCINHDKIDNTFGNARYIRELVDKAQNNQATRLQNDGYESDDDLFVLKPQDFWLEDLDEDSVQKCLDELNAMVGLASVKSEVQMLISQMQVQMEKEKRGLVEDSNSTLHMVFKGNPGTGKTTVARLIGRLYSAMGLLKRKDVFVEVNRSSLVGKYMGETAQNVKKAVSSANGGILFVDEAYSLIQGENDSFGQEAVDTLVAEMENNRKNMVVIFAGYDNDMDEFFTNNVGLKSRVPIELHFDDYSVDELMSIALASIKKKGMTIADDEAVKELRKKIEEKYTSVDFGNARGVRNIVEKLIRMQNMRVAGLLSSGRTVSNEEISAIITEDVLTI